jgi:hypothetical protein
VKIIVPRWRGGVRRPWVRAVLAIGSTAGLAAAMLASVAPAASAYGGYSTPAMAVAAGNTVIAVQTQSDGLRFYWNQYGTNTWRGEQVAADGTALSAPAITADGNGVIISVEGPNQSPDFYWQTDGTSTWHEETVAGANSTYSAPRLATIGNSVGIVAQGPQNSLIYYWAANGTSTWTPEWVGGYNTAYAAPAIAADGNSAVVAAEGPSNSLEFYWQQDGTTPWNPESVAGPGTTFAAPAITGNDGSANIAAAGPNETVDFYWQQNGTTPWHPEVIASGVGSPEDPDITTMNHGSGDGVCVTEGEAVWCAVDGSANWAFTSPGMWLPGSDMAITENGSSDNVALYYCCSPRLTFFWDDSSGNWHGETVDNDVS